MNRSRLRALVRLPSSLNPWEVALVEVPVTIEGVETEGMLVIAERGSGMVRAAGPVVRGESLWPVLGRAFTDPSPPCSPARPVRLFCPDPALVRRLSRELRGLGIGIDQVASVPAIDSVIASMQSHFAPLTAPGITVDLEAWASALETLARIAPWREVSDSVLFRFEGLPVLDEVVAILLGQAGEQRGIALYPTRADYEGFLDAALGGNVSALEQVEALNLYLDPIAELDPDEVVACREGGLVTSDGLCPRVLVLAGGVPSPATEQAQRVLLAVVQGITTLTARGAAELDLAPASCFASTCLGTVEVCSAPPEWGDLDDAPELVDAEHAVGVGRLHDADGSAYMALVVKLRKADAERLAGRLAGVDELRIEAEGAGYVVHALAGKVVLGALVRLWRAQDVEGLGKAARVVLCVSAGGPKRRRIEAKDFVMMRDVVVGAAAVRSGPGHDAVFDEPPARWPKASETLLRFAEPVLQEASALSATELGAALEMASTVWNAVVMADFVGESRYLEEVRGALGRAAGPWAIAQALIERKRARFAGDPRLLGPVRVDGKRAVPQVYVETRLPPGYEVGRGER